MIIYLVLPLLFVTQSGCLAGGWLRAGISKKNESRITKKIRNGRKVRRLDKAKSLPPWGKGYTTYSWLGAGLGRQYAHSDVINTLTDSFALLHKKNEVVYVVAEIGLRTGRSLSFHRSHKLGMKVDILTPMRNIQDGTPKKLPSSIFNMWGYCWSIDGRTHHVQGKKLEVEEKYIPGKLVKTLRIFNPCPTRKKNLEMEVDFRAMRDLIVTLKQQAPNNNLKLSSVILDKSFVEKLGKTGVRFHTNAWIRHDEHLHFSFVRNKR